VADPILGVSRGGEPVQSLLERTGRASLRHPPRHDNPAFSTYSPILMESFSLIRCNPGVGNWECAMYIWIVGISQLSSRVGVNGQKRSTKAAAGAAKTGAI
jgi:hypothetical protein